MTRAEEQRHGPGEARLWFGVLGSAAAWGLHLLVTYGLVELVCDTGAFWMFISETVVLVALAGVAILISWQNWRGVPAEVRSNLLEGGSRRAFMAAYGIVSGGIFLLAMIMSVLAIVFIDPCM